MGGLLHHLLAGLVSSLIVYKKFKHRDFSIAIFIGNLLHDGFVLAYAPFFLGTFNPLKIIESRYFLERDTVFILIWSAVQAVFVVSFLFFQKYIRKKDFKEFEYNIGFLLLGIITHAFMDAAIQEQGIFF